MIKVGLTGGMGSGKTTAAKIFSVLGIPVFDADTEAKGIMNEDEEVKKKIIALFGNDAYKNDELNRKYIAGIVFTDALKLDELNAIVHPVTIAASEKWMQQQTTPYAIKEAALMFESAAAENLEYIIGVFAPEHLRIQRIMQRDNITREQALSRMNRQIDEEIKMRLCDFVIVNDEQQLVIPQVLQLHEKLIAMAAHKEKN
ncbi:MAG: dephospho-CoA kinase [Parafilimonas sp.]